MKKTLAALLCLMLLAAPAWPANTVWIAQTALGAGTGVDAADAVAATYFNTAGNWSASPTGIQIGPATIVHLVGTITTTLVAQGNGSSGNPVTIFFEAGSSIQEPACPSNGCLRADSKSWITVEGNNVGIIESTANGSGLANHVNSAGIEMHPCANCVVQDLTIQNIYVHSSAADDMIDQTQMRCIYVSGSGWIITNNTMHDAGFCVYPDYGNGDAGTVVSNNNIYNVDHGVVPSAFGAFSASNFTVSGNHIHDYSNWDTTSGNYHHDGVHAYGSSGANLTNLQVYDNLFDGNPGNNFTSDIYFEKPDASTSLTGALAFNNVLDISMAPANTFGAIAVGALTTGTGIYNNTIVGANTPVNYCILLNGGNTNIENNIETGCQVFVFEFGAIPSVTMNFQTYAAIGSVGWQDSSSTQYHTLANWQATSTSPDANSQLVSSAGLSSGYTPNAGSAVIGAGTNLTSLGITALNSDKNNVARPGSGAWAAGAFQFVSAAGVSRGRLP